MQAREKLRRGFDNVYQNHRFLARIVQGWKVIEAPHMATCATDGPNFFYNPTFLDTLKIGEVTEVVLHEAGHIFLGHHLRFAEMDARMFNVAADLALNWHIMKHISVDSAIRKIACFPGEKQFSHLPTGKSAEWYYTAMLEEQPKEDEGKPDEGDGEAGPGEPGESDGESGDGDAGGDTGDKTGSQQGDDEGGQGSEDGQGEGSTVGGDEQDGNGSPSDTQSDKKAGPTVGGQPLPDTIGDVLPHPGEEGKEDSELVDEWKQKVARSIKDAQDAGTLPGWMKELGTQQYESRSEVDYKAILARFLTVASRNYLTFNRPNRRHQTLRLPVYSGNDAAPGCILVDTSASMDEKQMNKALTAIENILMAYKNCSVTMKQVDVRLIEDATREFTRWDFPLAVPVEWKGRGGTNLGGAMHQVAQEGKYSWLIVISDMYVHLGGVADPRIPTIFIRTAPKGGGYSDPNFGQVIGPIEV